MTEPNGGSARQQQLNYTDVPICRLANFFLDNIRYILCAFVEANQSVGIAEFIKWLSDTFGESIPKTILEILGELNIDDRISVLNKCFAGLLVFNARNRYQCITVRTPIDGRDLLMLRECFARSGNITDIRFNVMCHTCYDSIHNGFATVRRVYFETLGIEENVMLDERNYDFAPSPEVEESRSGSSNLRGPYRESPIPLRNRQLQGYDERDRFREPPQRPYPEPERRRRQNDRDFDPQPSRNRNDDRYRNRDSRLGFREPSPPRGPSRVSSFHDLGRQMNYDSRDTQSSRNTYRNEDSRNSYYPPPPQGYRQDGYERRQPTPSHESSRQQQYDDFHQRDPRDARQMGYGHHHPQSSRSAYGNDDYGNSYHQARSQGYCQDERRPGEGTSSYDPSRQCGEFNRHDPRDSRQMNHGSCYPQPSRNGYRREDFEDVETRRAFYEPTSSYRGSQRNDFQRFERQTSRDRSLERCFGNPRRDDYYDAPREENSRMDYGPPPTRGRHSDDEYCSLNSGSSRGAPPEVRDFRGISSHQRNENPLNSRWTAHENSSSNNGFPPNGREQFSDDDFKTQDSPAPLIEPSTSREYGYSNSRAISDNQQQVETRPLEREPPREPSPVKPISTGDSNENSCTLESLLPTQEADPHESEPLCETRPVNPVSRNTSLVQSTSQEAQLGNCSPMHSGVLIPLEFDSVLPPVVSTQESRNPDRQSPRGTFSMDPSSSEHSSCNLYICDLRDERGFRSSNSSSEECLPESLAGSDTMTFFCNEQSLESSQSDQAALIHDPSLKILISLENEIHVEQVEVTLSDEASTAQAPVASDVPAVVESPIVGALAESPQEELEDHETIAPDTSRPQEMSFKTFYGKDVEAIKPFVPRNMSQSNLPTSSCALESMRFQQNTLSPVDPAKTLLPLKSNCDQMQTASETAVIVNGRKTCAICEYEIYDNHEQVSCKQCHSVFHRKCHDYRAMKEPTCFNCRAKFDASGKSPFV